MDKKKAQNPKDNPANKAASARESNDACNPKTAHEASAARNPRKTHKASSAHAPKATREAEAHAAHNLRTACETEGRRKAEAVHEAEFARTREAATSAAHADETTATQLGILVNCSATMRALEERILEALNSVIAEHSRPESNAHVTLVLCGEKNVVAASGVPARSMAPFARGAFAMHGCGMLMDALYETIRHMERLLPDLAEGVKIVIITNDSEAASCIYPYADVLALVEEKRAAEWEFTLMTVC